VVGSEEAQATRSCTSIATLNTLILPTAETTTMQRERVVAFPRQQWSGEDARMCIFIHL
jgi:hypothetical protein